MVQMFMRGLKKVPALWSVHFRVSAFEGFVVTDSLGTHPGQNFLSVLERCPL